MNFPFSQNARRYSLPRLKTGYYSFRVRSMSLAINGSFTEPQYVNISEQTVSLVGTIAVTAVLIIICIASAIVVLVHRRYGWSFGRRNDDLHISRQNLTVESEESPIDDEPPAYQQNRYPFMELIQ